MLSEVRCPSCGAPVPLADASPTSCACCGGSVDLPASHVEAHRALVAGSADLAAAETVWRRLPPPMPRWIEPAFVVVVLVVVFALVLAWAFVLRDVAGGPGRGFVIFVMAPAFIGLQLGLELLAFWSPFARLERRFSATRDPTYPQIARCRVCGAPLSISELTVASRCDHCRSDNLVRNLRKAAVEHAREVAAEGREQIDGVMTTLRMLQLQRTVVRWVGPGVMLPVLAILAYALWSR